MNRRLFETFLTVLCIVAGSTNVAADGACCSDGKGDSQGLVQPIDEYFVATLHCKVVCTGGQTASTQIVRNFHPARHGLRPGNGSDGQSAPWGGFTGTLETWSQFVCLEYAAQQCSGLLRVDRIDVAKISSGEWILDTRVPCPELESIQFIETNSGDSRILMPDYRPVLSPFDLESGAQRSGANSETPTVSLPFPDLGTVLTGPTENPRLRRVDTYDYWMNRAVIFSQVPEHLITEAEIRNYLLTAAGVRSESEYVVLMKQKDKIAPAAPCTSILRGRACFGDCLQYPEGRAFEQYMATCNIGSENQAFVAVCGDKLKAFLAEHRMSEAAFEVYREKYLMDSLIQGRVNAYTCSSFRARAERW